MNLLKLTRYRFAGVKNNSDLIEGNLIQFCGISGLLRKQNFCRDSMTLIYCSKKKDGTHKICLRGGYFSIM